MTERLHSNPPQIATPINLGLDTIHPSESVDEEPYEIKCICDYRDDDGNTILCEKCDTWQHIECYYHGNAEDASREEFDHACVECNPRYVDGALATERQRKQRQLQETPDGVDKKSKRRVEKSHKKKARPADVVVNGWHHGDHDGASGRKNHSPQDHLPPKKVKSHHKSTNSVTSQAGKRSPSIGTHNARNHGYGRPSSPSRTPPDRPPTFEIHSYSPEFRRLYHEDPGAKQLPANTFSSLAVTNKMSSWLHDSNALKEDIAQKDTDGVFQKVITSQNDYFLKQLSGESLVVEDRRDYEQKLHWRFLTTTKAAGAKAIIIGELKGFVGFKPDYLKDVKNQYTLLAHPQPFVFFHPDLPIYIDTRTEGSMCRYIRRSCKPNVALETYIVNQSEYHFCIVNETSLTAGEQLTLPWDIHSQNKDRWMYLLGLSDQTVADEPEMSDIEYQEISKWVYGVLSAYGGCACDLGKDCAFVRFHRERSNRMQQVQTNTVKKRVGRPPKAKQHVSPTTTGHATNSRTSSENHHEPHDDHDHDSRSNSGSHRSKGRSRELSPRSLGDDEQQFGVGEALSERDKRKIAQLEEYSKRQTQSSESKQPPLKKKRTSAGSIASASTATGPKERAKLKGLKASTSAEPIQTNGVSNGSRKIHYADAATSRPMSESPNGMSPTDVVASQSRRASSQLSIRSRQASATARSTYCDMATQTDPVHNAWWSPAPPTPKRAHIPLAKRLISFRHNSRKDAEARMQAEYASALTNGTASRNGSMSSPISLPSPQAVHAQPPTPVAEGRRQSILSIAESAEGSCANDVPMPDAPPTVVSNTIKPPPPPWPGITTAPTNESLGSAFKPPDLRLQLPPAIQALDFSLHPVTTPGSITPSSIGLVAQSPFSAHHPHNGLSPSVMTSVTPSPVKKKLSLSDYSARFNRKAPSISENADKNKEPKSTTVNSSPTMSPAVLKSSENLLESVKLPSVLEGSAIIDTPSAEKEKFGDPMMGVVRTSSTSLPPAKTDQISG